MSTLTAAKVLCISWLVLALSGREGVNGQKPVTDPANRVASALNPVEVCGDIDIRNKVSQFRKVENCTVIEGSLRILLIEYSSEEEYNRLQYPNLVEVTEYVLLYRVYGLKTLRHIFPNLAIIRGQRLFYNYALVAYEMTDLEELGLANLTYIERGAVRLEKNPNLCYVRTIDWTKIAVNVKMEDNFFKGNKNHSECVNICPSNCRKTAVDGNSFPRCWTKEDCQQILDCPRSSSCKSFCYHGHCCHEKCVGGCIGPTVEDCIACKNVTDHVDGKLRCMDRCAPGTYKFRNRRCLRDVECAAMNMTLIPYKNEKPGECALSCPVGYTRDTTSNISKCVPCKGRCPKVCPPKRVDSVTAAQTLRDCTIIKGPLEIRIMTGSNIGLELEANLGQIEEVMAFIWIHASHSLLSLNFFRNLRKIHGKNLYSQRFALLVSDNSNLQKLFTDEVENNLEIVNGGIFMQFNRKLCYNKISEFTSKVKMNSSEHNDISYTNNGDQMPCHLSTLNLKILQVSPRVAFLRWENFKIPDQRNLLSYVIHYKEAPKKNVSIYDDRDACSDDFWKTKDVLNKNNQKNDNETHLFEIIVSLKPWTQYAVYVETYTTALATKGAMSKLVYFRTAASTPTIPFNLNVKARKPGQLLVTWEPPQQPHGNVTHYEVYWRRRELQPSKYEVRNYCNSPLYLDEPEQEKVKKVEEESKNKTKDPNYCLCPKSNEEMEEERVEREMQIKFQNYLQTVVYIKRTHNKRRKSLSRPRHRRDLIETHATNETYLNKTYTISSTPNPENVTSPKKHSSPYYRAVVMKREFIISNLGHFEDYNIEVIACQERDPRESYEKKAQKLCSSRALAVARTLTSKTADNIDPTTIHVNVLRNKTGDVVIKWKEPPSPNGIIITYEIKYKKSDISNVQPTVLCITSKDFKKTSGYKLTMLDSGNYTFNIRATSLAGNGSWTESKYFVIDSPQDAAIEHQMIIVVCVVVGVVFVIITGVVVWCVARRRFINNYPEIQNVSVNPEYMADYQTYTPDSWEVDRDKVKLLRELGQGSFGMVYEGLAIDLNDYPGEFKVAVKTVNDNASYSERMSFLSEASIMKSFKCDHVVKLLGVVSEGVAQGKQAYVIMELMSHGDLKNFLRLHRPDEEDNDGRQPPTLREIMQMAGEIADGMAYLADKKFVHRDLAARNCMVADDYTVKIGDFGMTRDIYETDYYRKGGKGLLPVRWMAPESLKDGIFTSMSDVWSYGVVLWEMATLAAQPYQGLSNEEVLKYVINAKTMDKPEGCPEKLFELMYLCWKYKPKQRPTFKEIIEMLVPDLHVSFKERSYFFSEENRQDAYCDEYDDTNQDDSNVPFISDGVSEGATGGDYRSHDLDDEDVDFVDLDVDYKLSKYDHNRSATASEMCDCILLQETAKPPTGSGPSYNSHNSLNNHTYSSNSNSNSAIASSNEGSKESSKSSNSSYAPMNGLNIPPSIANGHVPVHMRSPTC